jgi:glycosyltransferase involved in cell wall biosynthesis
MKKILQLSTYPLENAMQASRGRASQIRKYFENHRCKVKTISLTGLAHNYNRNTEYFLRDSELSTAVVVPFCEDYATSLICQSGEVYKFLKNKIADYKPDIIFLEKVWLWPAVRNMLREKVIPISMPIVYSSHNVEYLTKKSLFDKFEMRNNEVKSVIKDIYDLEKDICEMSQCVIACSKSDGDIFLEMGAKAIKICPNGAMRINENAKLTSYLLNGLGMRNYALFSGSAYPVNAIGFWEMMGDSLAWLPPEYMVIVVGGVSKILEDFMSQKAKLYDLVNIERIKRITCVSEELLTSLIINASVILLPVTIDRGANLITAEAIASCKPIVSTSLALNGFDFIGEVPSLKVTDNKQKYIKNVYDALNVSRDMSMYKGENIFREMIYWENTLKELGELL